MSSMAEMPSEAELRAMSLDELLDERVNLRIRISLGEDADSNSQQPLELLKARLAQLERVVKEQRRLDWG